MLGARNTRAAARTRVTTLLGAMTAAVVVSSLLSFLAPTIALPVGGAAIGPGEASAAGDETVLAAVSDFGYDHPDMAFLKAQVDGWNPDYVFTMGDNWQYANWPAEKGPEPQGTARYDLVAGRLFCKYMKVAVGTHCPSNQQAGVNRFFPVVGNHDYDHGPIANYEAYFTLPGAGTQSVTTTDTDRYYDVRMGNVHLFAVNSEQPATFNAQKTWLQGALAASTAPWKIVALHQPVFGSSEGYGSTAGLDWDFDAWGADAVMNGHAGLYERVMRSGLPYITAGIGGGIGSNIYGQCKPVGQRVSGSQKCYGWLSTDIPGGNWDVMGAVKLVASTTELSFEVRTVAQDGNVLLDSFSLTKAGPPTVTVTTASPLAAATQGTAYSRTLQATGGSTPYSWTRTSGSLPAGLTLSSAGVISGTPTGTGTSTFSVRATDNNGVESATKSLSITVNPAPVTVTVTTASPLPGGNQNSPYSTTLAASGGASPYTWAVTSGSLPAGLTLSSAGVISGTPTGTGTSTFSVRATDNNSVQSATKSLAITVAATGGKFVGITPVRPLDTRTQAPCVSGPNGRELVIAPHTPVPANAAAVALNITVTGATAPGFLTVHPTGTPRPTASNLNYAAGQTIPNAVTTKVGTGGKITLYASGGCPHVIVDIAGYYTG